MSILTASGVFTAEKNLSQSEVTDNDMVWWYTIYTQWSGKKVTLFLPVTLPNADWFSKFFQRQT